MHRNITFNQLLGVKFTEAALQKAKDLTKNPSPANDIIFLCMISLLLEEIESLKQKQVEHLNYETNK